MMTWHIHIEGQVQGVGFRPFVYRLAHNFQIKGWVNNANDGVHIEFNAYKTLAQEFYQALINKAPVLSQITRHRIWQIEDIAFSQFEIIHSQTEGKASLLISPDFALCTDCKRELLENANRRYHYPFITCTNCGPRYSIMKQLPYDRATTTMDSFEMCHTCQDEYQNPLDRRYYSQTNSCATCSIELALLNQQLEEISKDSEKIIIQIVKAWQAGEIVAIKGIGGYILTCDATNTKAIQNLRQRKHRPTKPLALMYPHLEAVKEDLEVCEEEQQSLNGVVSPIVLLNLKEKYKHPLAIDDIAPSLEKIGLMLPYTPLYVLLLEKFQKPIIATSGNMSSSPILFEDEKALAELPNLADWILLNNREIVIPQDDSVLQFSHWTKQKIILRRSRGLAPSFIHPHLEVPQENILAMGASLKSTFTFAHQGNIYVSQYLGDLGDADTQESYHLTLQHFFNLFQEHPKIILSDKHPQYGSTQYGQKLAEDFGGEIYEVQHHMAHFGAILGEHNLLEKKEPILGIIWDGTGLGNDGQIWGGEFFIYQNYDFSRVSHFAYFDFILGNKMPREPRISALTISREFTEAQDILIPKFNKTEWKVYQRLLEKENLLQTSSLGRIFDALASLLHLADIQSYEGEAAMQLEKLAQSYFLKHGLDFSESYFEEGVKLSPVPSQYLFAQILQDIKKGNPRDFIAAKFHFSLVDLVARIAQDLNIRQIACSGGVFQNSLLVDLMQYHLAKKFTLYFHQELSPNDENISFGQLMCYQIQEHKKLFHYPKSDYYVFSHSR